MLRALAGGGGVEKTFQVVSRLRAEHCDVPLVLFGYYNPIYVYGLPQFAQRCHATGVDAVLTVDLPIDEISELAVPLQSCGVAVVPLVAPTSGSERIMRLRQLAPPFVYYISMTGVTGSQLSGATDIADRVRSIREAAAAPVAVGFGVKTAEDAARMRQQGADGVVVGSAIVDSIYQAQPGKAAVSVASLVGELRTALS